MLLQVGAPYLHLLLPACLSPYGVRLLSGLFSHPAWYIRGWVGRRQWERTGRGG